MFAREGGGEESSALMRPALDCWGETCMFPPSAGIGVTGTGTRAWVLCDIAGIRGRRTGSPAVPAAPAVPSYWPEPGGIPALSHSDARAERLWPVMVCTREAMVPVEFL